MAAPAQAIPVLLLKEGTTRTVGRDARRTNILAARIIAETLASSLGPRGMDKLLVDSFGSATITGDGATILKEMDVQHPAAKMLVEVAKAQDDEVGDGTTSVVVLAGEFLKNAEELLDSDIHPTIITEGYERALEYLLKEIDKIAVKVDPLDVNVLKEVAKTALSSKVVAQYKDFLADLAVKAVLQVVEKTDDGKYKVDLDNIKIEKKKGESIEETMLINGIVLDKEVVHPGMPKRVENAKIALINAPLEIEKPEWTAKINITNPEQLRAFLDQEAALLKKMVDKIAEVGANVVITQKGIDDLAQHFLAKRGILAVRRVKKSDMEKLAKATGARIVTSIEDLTPEDLGYAGLVEERKVADDKMVFVEECKNPKAVTILVRGGAEHIVDETERALHDALCVIRNVVQEPKIVAGGGAIEIELARRLKEFAKSLGSKEQLAVEAYAEALEKIPTILAQNAGIEPVDAIVELRNRHEKGEVWSGVDVINGKISDMMKLNIIEPAIVKKQTIKSATEAAIMILRIDDIIAAAPPKEKKEKGSEEKTPGFE
ncbi:MAG: thermosome subunit [Thermoprotei archaeon]|nr:MAG: thermosome subunit [Thermofilum sp. ex4484_79]RLE61412.1 MAG: thermosome subunit [Thermoprotei archaeon]HDD64228.1 thermosome subunit [Thermoprotei archaeon]